VFGKSGTTANGSETYITMYYKICHTECMRGGDKKYKHDFWLRISEVESLLGRPRNR
jgi:hypothetical protein